jgi:hypothetical protein
MKSLCYSILAASCIAQGVYSFGVLPPTTAIRQRATTACRSTPDDGLSKEEIEVPVVIDVVASDESPSSIVLSKEEKEEQVGNLVADDEWEGLGMELSELVRVAVIQDLKQNAREFLGKDDYKIGDLSKEIDSRVKNEVASLRGKDEYELGDFVFALDEMSKSMTEELTGKPYKAGDLSKEIDSRVKSAVADYCGKDEYELGDLSTEIDKRVKSRVEEFTGKDEYEFGDITREVNNRRRDWVKDYLGEQAAEQYEFGDITKKAISSFTGKDEYEFGDLTKKLANSLFGKRKGKK